MTDYDVIVIGGGAAGLMAAGQAGSRGAKVLVLEKMGQPARKLRITGKGRCNLTNLSPVSEFIGHIQPNGKFLRQAFAGFFTTELLDFMKAIGVPTVTERGQRVFPASEKAQDVVDALVRWAKKNKVEIRCNSQVAELLATDSGIQGVKTKEGEIIRARSVILATGGKSYPATGSTGDGYKLASMMGHTIHEPFPSLVPIETTGYAAQDMQGLSLKNVTATLWSNGKKIAEEFGEMLFTHFGLSGPIILTLSRTCVEEMNKGNKISISIDLKPALDEQKLDARLLRDLNEHGKMMFKTVLQGLLPAKMIPVCAGLVGIPADKPCNQISSAERKKLRYWLKNFTLGISGHRSFAEAIITAGGVDTQQVNPKTMESKFIKGLYFAGELLDLDADTGGYNLQIAFSTGWAAGNAAASFDQEIEH
ncbi:MAG: NAD(P)/FAD-dependent oxidoreductase [Bacteroidota bacterium]|nr:NAD(P)/FAD-dependent oxidoreductase [Bacteroidota bacterium]